MSERETDAETQSEHEAAADVESGRREREPEARGFTVTDRRWWARSAGDDGGQQSERKPTYVDELERKLAAAEAGVRDARERQRAALEDVEQAKRRVERDAQRGVERQRRELLASFVPLVDDLDRALEAGRAGAGAGAVVEGVGLVRQRFLAKLAEHGVSRVEPRGSTFDPRLHEALTLVPVTDPGLDNRVIDVVAAGYAIGDEPLRPAQVTVGRVAGTA